MPRRIHTLDIPALDRHCHDSRSSVARLTRSYTLRAYLENAVCSPGQSTFDILTPVFPDGLLPAMVIFVAPAKWQGTKIADAFCRGLGFAVCDDRIDWGEPIDAPPDGCYGP
jgi:hypothetical protein